MFGISRKDRNAPAPPFQPTTPPEALVYVVGDIHGRADLLARMIDMLRADSATMAGQYRPIIVFLGDYVDRGASSREVISSLIALQNDDWFKIFCLRGNHDQVSSIF